MKLHELIKNEIGEHCELSVLNNDCNTNYVNIFSLFKKANIRWRLFNRQSIFEEIFYIRYKGSRGTHWVKHQSAALNLLINNLLVFIGFCNNQILLPHNAQIKKIQSNLVGYKNDVCEIKKYVLRISNLNSFYSLSLLVKHFKKLLF